MNQDSRTRSSVRRVTLAAAVCLILITALVYVPHLGHEIVDLDCSCWIEAVYPPGMDRLKLIFSHDPVIWAELGYFAPITAVSIMADVWIGDILGNRELMLKLTNISIHMLNCLLVLWLMTRLGFDAWIAFMVAAVFSVHPLQYSSIAWVAERKNLLVSFFYFVAMALYYRYRLSGKTALYLGAFCALLFGLLSKPSAVALGPCLVAIDWFIVDKRLSGKSALRAVPFLAFGLVWALVAVSTEKHVDLAPPFLERLLQAPYNMLLLLAKFFLPADLSFIYPPVHVDPGSVVWWLPWVLFLIGGAVLIAIHRRYSIWFVLFGAVFWAVNMVPSSGIVPFSGMRQLYVANHYQYLACMGLSLILVLAMARAAGVFGGIAARATRLFVTCACLGVLIFLSGGESEKWQDTEALWQSVIDRHPGSFEAHFNYANHLDEQGRYSEAAARYTAALSVAGNRWDSCKVRYNLGLTMMRMGEIRKAVENLNEALVVNPDCALAHLALSRVYFIQSDFGLAMEHCEAAQARGARCDSAQLWELIRKQALKRREPKTAGQSCGAGFPACLIQN